MKAGISPPPAPERVPARGRIPAFLRRPGGIFGAGWLALLVLLSVTAPLWERYSPDAQSLSDRFATPSAAHWLGTDELGRDLFTRIFVAAGPTLLASALTVVVAFAIAVPLTLLAAHHGPRVERWASRGAEIMLALPATVILLALIGAVGTRTYLVMAVLGVLVAAPLYRVLLGTAQSLRRRLYVDAAIVDGVEPLRVSLRYVLPGLATVMAVQASQLFAVSILLQSGLAFMGFGPPAPAPSWGGMIAAASQAVNEAPWLMVPTGVVLALTVVAANQLADAFAASVVSEPEPSPTARRRAASFSPPPRKAPEGGVEPLLAVDELSVSIDGGPPLVTGISLEIGSGGEVLGLVGESGCGKTLTALSILGMLPPGVAVTAGSIRWRGHELLGLSERELRRVRGSEIAMVPQDPMVALDPLFTVGAQLGGAIRRLRGVGRGAARRSAQELLTSVGIPDPERVMRVHPHELSGGMAQRVVIALSLSGDPDLLIADEPTTALDVTRQAEILDLLRRLADERGIAVVFVTHDLGVVADICDEVAVIYAGQAVEQGAAATVLTHPRHPYTMALLAANPHFPAGDPIPGRLATLPGSVPPVGQWPTGCRFATRCCFAQDSCRRPVDLLPGEQGTLVRCARAAEIDRRGLRWQAIELEVSGAEKEKVG